MANQFTHIVDAAITLPSGQAEFRGSTVEVIACQMRIAGIERQVLQPWRLIHCRITQDKTLQRCLAMEYEEAQAGQSATRQPGKSIVQPGEGSWEAEADEALIRIGTHGSDRCMVGEHLGYPHIAQLRHQTVRCQDDGLYPSLLIACHQRTAEAHGIVLALE